MNNQLFNWLKDYKELMEQIEYLEFNLKSTELELKRWEGGDLSNVFLVKDSKGSQVEEKIFQIINELTIKKDQKEKMVRLISKFTGVENKILKMKYVDGMTLDVVAEELNYSSSYIYKKHSEIRRRVDFISEDKGDYEI